MSARARVSLRLYVAGDAPNSQLAVQRLQAFCTEHLANRHSLEIVDIIREPGRALADRVLLTPTLVKLAPAPVRTVIGNLGDADVLAQALGVRDGP